ncbi:hypothetical protein AMC99_02448 [Altererythrobacter epoxidivorans]|uniref:Phosphatidate cytidylyltransferase n=1 Tax=Altererythrobacter epoxidivorans TaxID=361183 RepID=A0A0M3TAV2_9SPHN|nr:hypothetical protein [Altererythrobacter epoxidivorans]ALE17722.1 hypothetical protein AMC99_02448 [Altererythrobacter epoxidivorans]
MEALEERIGKTLSAPVNDAVASFASRLAQECGALAVLFYGSNLRTGSLDGVLDYYVLLPGEQAERIWPRVSYREWDHNGETLRAKIATMSLKTFAEASRGELLDTTIWARFVQPSALVWARDEAAAAQMRSAIASAAQTATRLAVALGPERGTAEDYWRALFRATYQAEFRVEKPGREDSILSVNAQHFDGLLPLALAAQGIEFGRAGDVIEPKMAEPLRRQVRAWWAKRRRMGKPMNVIRLVKASTTFDGAARYAAWKVERHTGVPVKLTPWREKHPVLAAPGVLFNVWWERRKRGD